MNALAGFLIGFGCALVALVSLTVAYRAGRIRERNEMAAARTSSGPLRVVR